MHFIFVDNATVQDKRCRKLIRSQCMKGKNAGKKLVRRVNSEDTDALDSRRRRSGAKDSLTGAIHSVYIGPFAGFSFAFCIDPKMHRVLHRFLLFSDQAMYPVEYCHPKRSHDYLSLSYLLNDETFCNCFLAIAAAYSSMMGDSDKSEVILRYLSKTYRCINRDLQQNIKPSEPTIAAVMSIAIHEDLLGQSERSEVHINALSRMVNIRGGLGEFKENKFLIHKICRADLCHALQLGSRPLFYRDEFPREMVESMIQHHGLRNDISLVVRSMETIKPDLQSIMWDMTSVSYILQRRLAKFDPLDFQEMLISILYRLLNLNPPWNSSMDTVPHTVQVYCLSLLAFASTILFNIRRRKRLPYELLAAKLGHALLIMPETASLERTALLWTLFVGGISVLQDDALVAVMPRIRTIASSLGITDWEGAKAHLGQYPWLDAFHDEPGQRLWAQVIES